MNKTPITRKPQNWCPQDIKDALARKGISQAAIARELGLHPTTVGDVVNGIKKSKRIHTAIAEAICREIKEIWPEIYLHGEPKRGRKKTIWHRQAA